MLAKGLTPAAWTGWWRSHVTALVTRAAARRSGVARGLMAAAIEFARERAPRALPGPAA